MTDYDQKWFRNVQRLAFSLDDQVINGEGHILWDPKKGFLLDAVTSPLQLPSPYEIRMIQLPRKTDFASVRIQFSDGSRGWIPSLCLVESRGSLFEKRLRIRFPRMVLIHKNEIYKKLGDMSSALFHVQESSRLPNVVRTEYFVGDRSVGWRSSRAGVLLESDSFYCCGRIKEGRIDNRLQLDYSVVHTNKDKSPKVNFPKALEVALGMLTGSTVGTLVNKTHSGPVRREEVSRPGKPISLGYLGPFFGQHIASQDRLIKLIDFFLRETKERAICFKLFDQLVLASTLRDWRVTEFIIGSSLEAFLRSYFNEPFVPGMRRGYPVRERLDQFAQQRFDSTSWDRHKERVIGAYNELRHRNAHPDWVDISDATRVHEVHSKSVDEMVFLAQFYGHVILALAGIPESPMTFPKSHSEWGPVMTLTWSPQEV